MSDEKDDNKDDKKDEKKDGKKDNKKCKEDEDLCNKIEDGEQAVLINTPCPGACTVRSACCVIKPDPVEPPECYEPFDYCAIQEPKPKPPKLECPNKNKCPGNKDKKL